MQSLTAVERRKGYGGVESLGECELLLGRNLQE